MGEEKLQTFINFALRYMSELKLPAKRGTFVEFRNGLINLCPVGRSCTQEERDQFEAYDKVRQRVVPFAQLFVAKYPNPHVFETINIVLFLLVFTLLKVKIFSFVIHIYCRNII